MIRRSIFLATACLGLLSTTCSADLTIAQYAPQRNDRYYQGADRAFIAEGYDLSGVGKTGDPLTNNTSDWANLISPHFALTAAHATPAVGTTITFFPGNDPTATPVTAVVSGTYVVPGITPGESDMTLLRFGTAVSGVNPFAIVENNENILLGKQIFVYGQTNRVGTNNIDFLGLQPGIGPRSTYAMYYGYNPTNGNPNEAELNAHDSGGPSFVIGQGNQLALAGIHSFLSDPDPVTGITYSGDTFVPRYLPELNTLIAGLNSQFGYTDSIRTIRAVPEPASALLLIAGGAGLIGFARRKQRSSAGLPGQ